jgi:hypothetical protein
VRSHRPIGRTVADLLRWSITPAIGALARLTAAGARLAGDLQQRHQAYQKRLLDGVSQREQERVLQTFRRLRDNLAQENS